MEILWWLAVPVIVTAIAGLVLSRRGRHATPEEQRQGIDEMERFRAAMSKPLPRHRDHE